MKGISALVLALISLWARPSDACNEVVCASMVSKCMLTQACKCDLTKSDENECLCCRDCSKCLGYLHNECCSCLGMCPPKTHDNGKKDSQVGDLLEPFPQLFGALTAEKDPHLRWVSMTFPIDVNLDDAAGNNLDKNKYKTVTHPQDTAPVDQVTVNCTVLYMSQCMSANKCKENCASTGATAYRWFFDGCCECVGGSCINYGVNESRCIDCPMASEDEDAFDEELTDQHLSGNTANTLDEEALQGDILSDPEAAR